MRWATLAVFVLACAWMPPSVYAQTAPEKPNILFIMTDDENVGMRSKMPKLTKNVIGRGVSFENAFATTPQCCPSRASFLTGKYAHNHTVYDNDETVGGFAKMRSSGADEDTVATRLDAVGYQTILIGKYLNWYEGKYIPPGWDEWNGQMGRNNDHRYNRNGEVKYYDPERYHDTDLFKNWATGYVRREADKARPFFMYLAVNSPHGPAVAAERHEDRFTNARLPRPPSFDEADVSDKPGRVRNLSRLSDKKIQEMTKLYRDRLRAQLSVDDLVGRLVEELRRTGELDNTYIVYTSDHGFHMGQHRLRAGKTKPYEEDIRVPMYVRGPGVPAGETLPHMVLNTDLAPTLAALARAAAPEGADGTSFASLLGGSPPPEESWRERFLAEFYKHNAPPGSGLEFKAVRTDERTYVKYDGGDRELYDLEADPYQLESLHADPAHVDERAALEAQLQELKGCAGDACRTAEGFSVP